MEISGRVIKIIAKKGVNKNNEEYVTRDIVVEYDGGQYPKRIVLSVYSTAAKPRWNTIGVEEGGEYTFGFDIDAHEYNGRWFNSLNAWKAEKIESYAQIQANEAAEALADRFCATITSRQSAPQVQAQPADKLPF